jgi:hypothetical protein
VSGCAFAVVQRVCERQLERAGQPDDDRTNIADDRTSSQEVPADQ